MRDPGRIVWHGQAEDSVSRDATAVVRTRKVREAVTTLLERYPPAR